MIPHDQCRQFLPVINRVPGLLVAGTHVKQQMRDRQIDCRRYAYEQSIDKPEIRGWRWSES